MANDLNQVFLIGRLVRDPEFKTIGGNSLVNFSIACGRVYVSNGEKREESHFFDCESWGKLADVIQKYTQKGKQIAVQGRLKQDTWETQEGKKASKIRIVVENMQLLGSKMNVEESSSNTQENISSNGMDTSSDDEDKTEQEKNKEKEEDEEIPF